MASSAASDVFAILALLGISLAVILIIRRYLPLRSTPAYLSTPIFLALALPTSAIVLLPIDLASSARTEDEASKGIWLPPRAVLVSWRILYWLTFVLTWIVLPLLGEYMDAGYRDPKARIIYSMRSNGRYQLIMLSCSAVGLVYMIISYGFDFTAIKGVVMALAYVWGLILAIYLMGHGLVAVPRRLFRRANIAGSLRMVQANAPKVHENLEDAVISLEDIETQIQQLKQRKTGTARHFQDWIDELVESTGQVPSRITLATPELAAATIPNVITERYLADLTRRHARARRQQARYVREWDDIVQEACYLQNVLDSKASGKLTFGPSISSFSGSRYTLLTPQLRFYLHVHLLPAFRLFSSAVFALASIAIIQSELIRPWFPQYSIVSLTVIHKPNSKSYQIGLGGQSLASVWICYMVFCTLSSMTVVPTWNQRALVQRNTHAESACWYAGQIARLTVPLAYNFLTFLPDHIQKSTTFHNFLGRLIELTALGKWFDDLFPLFILIPVVAALFGLYGRIKRMFGFGFISVDDEENPSSAAGAGWREGRDLIARDLSGPHASSSLGLTSSPRGSLDAVQGASRTRDQPTLWVPPATRSRSLSPNSTTTNTAGAPLSATNGRSRQNRHAVTIDPEPDEENFFSLFGQRVKNTFETIETPKWMQNNKNNSTTSGDSGSGFKRPKWLGGDSDGDDGDGIIDRLFGGAGNSSSSRNNRGQDGRIVI